ncbi:MAG TPA: hypothetical protein VKF79_05380 [Candidatus Acidoferrum sp.]|nr:hypothetical protein [Candidatus Acidoferrum sp.]
MKVAISIHNDVLREAKQYAKDRKIPLGRAISNLVWYGLRAPFLTRRLANGLHVADLPPGTPVVTLEHIKKIQEEMDAEDLKKCEGESD